MARSAEDKDWHNLDVAQALALRARESKNVADLAGAECVADSAKMLGLEAADFVLMVALVEACEVAADSFVEVHSFADAGIVPAVVNAQGIVDMVVGTWTTPEVLRNLSLP